MKTIAVMALTAVLVTACGCSFNGLLSPKAVVSSATVTSRTAEGARIEVAVDLENPNTVPLPLVGAEYTLSLEGVGSVAFQDPANRTIPANGVQRLVLPAAFPTSRGGAAGATYRVSGTVTYEPPGEFRRILTDSRIALPKVEFSGSGRLQ